MTAARARRPLARAIAKAAPGAGASAGANTALDNQIGGPDQYQDPYAEWALQTNFRAFKRRQKVLPNALTFLVELHHPYDPAMPFIVAGAAATPPAVAGGARTINIGGVDLQVPLAYERALPHTGLNASFITVRLDTKLFELLPSDMRVPLRKVVRQLMAAKLVKRLQIGFQRPGFDDLVADPVPPALDPPSNDAPGDVPKVVLGVVEDACPFGHTALLHGGRTRIDTLWDQSIVKPPVTAPWADLAAFPYGQQLGQDAMHQLIATYSTSGGLDEAMMYADERLKMRALTRRPSHAAAVLALLAGPPPALGRGTPDDGAGLALVGADGAAPPLLAPLVVVQLPREQTTISAGRWLAVNALDALHFVMGRARQWADGAAAPALVVNLSYGAIAGPHDGTSLLESALDELCAGYTNMAVVLAAGNTHGMVRNTDALDQCDYLPGGVHATQDLPAGGAVTFTLLAPADKPFETALELWFSDLAEPADQDQWLDIGEVEVTVTSPDGSNLVAGCGAQYFHPVELPSAAQPTPEPPTTAGLIFKRKPSQSLHRSMALLVLAATRVHADFVEAPAGRWTVVVRNVRQAGARPLQVQAWVERDDSTYGIDRPQSARLVPNDGGDAGHLDDHNILSNLASGRNTLSVGALVQLREVADPARWMVSAYSAAGPSGTAGPALSALADAGVALSGIRTAGSQSGMVLRTNGTSMAAPLAARWIAQQLAGGQTLAQIKAAVLAAPGRNARRGMAVP